MIEIENTHVYGFESAFTGMRNPKNSWDRMDSDFSAGKLGENDLALAQKLIRAGGEHSKFMRMIHVACDITAPDYWTAQLDTYKVGTTKNSCSFMHKGLERPFRLDDFAIDGVMRMRIEHLASAFGDGSTEVELSRGNMTAFAWLQVIEQLNAMRLEYRETKEESVFGRIRALLPEGYKKRFTWGANYAVLRNIYFQRRSHRLYEWHEFCEWAEGLPYAKELICIE